MKPAEIILKQMMQYAFATVKIKPIISGLLYLKGQHLMQKSLPLGKFAGLEISADPFAILTSLGLWAAWSAVVILLFGIESGPAIAGGLLATALHWFGEMFHQYGHARAARRTGYPMRGVHLWSLLATSVYPPDEGDLPPETHIRRALGGPLYSLGMALIAAVMALLLWPTGGVLRLLGMFFFLENLLVFGLGAFIPLGFTDGSTILRWWGKGGQQPE